MQGKVSIVNPALSTPLTQSHHARKIPQQHPSVAKLFSKFHVDESTWMDGQVDMHSSNRTLLPASKAGNHGQRHSHDYNQKCFCFLLFHSAKKEKFIYVFSSKKLPR